jgi:hypothetical protein
MDVTAAQAGKAVRRNRVKWDRRVRDPRQTINQVHSHHGLLSVLVGAFACGRLTLRKVEDFCSDARWGRRQMGLEEVASDSTFYRLLSRQEVAGFRETLWNQIRDLARRGRLGPELFPVGVLAADGKLQWRSTGPGVEGAKVVVDERNKVITSSLMSLRMVLVSRLSRPCLDIELLGTESGEAGEAPAFREAFPRVVEQFGDQFQVVTGDAGVGCRENAALIREHRKHYVFGFKENQPRVCELAQQRFPASGAEPLAEAEEVAQGLRVQRRLHAVSLTEDEQQALGFAGAKQLWRVQRHVFGGDKLLRSGVRYFITSLPEGHFNRQRELALVRLHWGIENSHNWTMDTALLEDARKPCQQSREALEVVGWLRELSYNLLAAFRVEVPKKDRRLLPWSRCMELLRDAWVALQSEGPSHIPG